jgi:hypothetical protein
MGNVKQSTMGDKTGAWFEAVKQEGGILGAWELPSAYYASDFLFLSFPDAAVQDVSTQSGNYGCV